jgi:hypothetical protein
MISVHVTCPACLGVSRWDRCRSCDGIGRAWAPGAPGYGCSITLADRDPGEVVTLGTGEQARILWHMPRRSKKVRPETTFLGMIGEFDGVESYAPIAFPSVVGVLTVDVRRASADHEAHDRSKTEDLSDPVFRQLAGRLI